MGYEYSSHFPGLLSVQGLSGERGCRSKKSLALRIQPGLKNAQIVSVLDLGSYKTEMPRATKNNILSEQPGKDKIPIIPASNIHTP